jgi:Kef-type K+ transport system membrane component KefB
VLLVAVLLLCGIAGKLVAGLGVLDRRVSRMMVGVGMVPRGEVGLIFADLGRRSGVVGNEVFGAILLVVMVTTFIAPPALKALFGRAPKPT